MCSPSTLGLLWILASFGSFSEASRGESWGTVEHLPGRRELLSQVGRPVLPLSSGKAAEGLWRQLQTPRGCRG